MLIIKYRQQGENGGDDKSLDMLLFLSHNATGCLFIDNIIVIRKRQYRN